MEAEEYGRSTSLAEKYMDFRILVEVCEKTNSTERRNKYLTQFADKVRSVQFLHFGREKKCKKKQS